MKIPFVEHHNFHFDFFEKNEVPPFYDQISGVPKSFFNATDMAKNKVHIVNCVPPYIFGQNDSVAPDYGCFSNSYRMGFAMDLTNFNSAEDYFRERLGNKSFKNLQRKQQKLERNFDIHLENYYGEIDQAQCENLLNTLKGFIESRFEGRTQKHLALNRWDFYAKTTYKNICSKKASLFVVYNNHNPIAMTLNYHYKSTFSGTLTSFHQDYYRYSLGKLMAIWLVDWCYKNGYTLLDMGWGNQEYKIKFANAVYYYSTDVFYPKKSIFKKILAYFTSWFLMKKYFLITLRGKKLQNPEDPFENRWLELERFKP